MEISKDGEHFSLFQVSDIKIAVYSVRFTVCLTLYSIKKHKNDYCGRNVLPRARNELP